MSKSSRAAQFGISHFAGNVYYNVKGISIYVCHCITGITESSVSMWTVRVSHEGSLKFKIY